MIWQHKVPGHRQPWYWPGYHGITRLQQGFLFTQISGHSLIKILKVLNISKLQVNFCIYLCEFYMPLVRLRSKCPVTKFGQQNPCYRNQTVNTLRPEQNGYHVVEDIFMSEWWSPVNSPHKGQSRRALMFSLICAWINGWVNNRDAGDLRCHRTHYDVTVMVNENCCIWIQISLKFFHKGPIDNMLIIGSSNGLVHE